MGRSTSDHSRRLSFAPNEEVISPAIDTPPLGEREGQISHVLLQASQVCSDSFCESLLDVVGPEICLQTESSNLRQSENELSASRLATLTPAVRSQIVQSIIDAVSAQVENNVGAALQEDSETSEMLTTICVIRRSIILLQLYNSIWLESVTNSNIGTMNDDDTSLIISHNRKLQLLRWAITADSAFDPLTEFDTILRTIVGTEKTLVTLTQIKKPFLMSAKRSAQVSTVITRFFLLGFWDQAIGLLKRCYSYPDDATSEFVSIVRSHFPPESYVCDDLDSDRHPMNHPLQLSRFRQSLRDSFSSSFRLSEDHLLRKILFVMCDLPDPDEDSAWDASMDESREGPEVLAEIFMAGDGSEDIVCFAASLFWLGHQLEGCCHSAVRLAEQNAIGFIFQKWWHSKGCHQKESAVADVAFALLLGNDIDKLLEHLNFYWWYFMPLLPTLMAFMSFYDFELSEDQMTSSLLANCLDAADQIADGDAFKEAADQTVASVLRPYILTMRALAKTMKWSLPQLLTTATQSITTPQRLTAHRHVLRAVDADLNTKSHVRGTLLTRLLEKEDQFSPLAFFLAIELAQDATDFFKAWMPAQDEAPVPLSDLKPLPTWPFRMTISAQRWADRVLTDRAIESHSMEALRKHPFLTEKCLAFLKGPLLPMRLVEVAVTIEFANATSSKATIDTSVKVTALLLRLLEHISVTGRDIDDSMIWRMLHQLAVERNVRLPREFVEDSVMRHYTRLCPCDEKRDSKLRTLRTLRLLANDKGLIDFTTPDPAQVRVRI